MKKNTKMSKNQPGKKKVESKSKESMGGGKPVRGAAQRKAAKASRKDSVGDKVQQPADQIPF
jgi:hypothetical protein